VTAQNLTRENFFESVLKVAPDFRSTYEEHIKDNDEVLVHLLMADLTRFVLTQCSECAGVPGSILPLLSLLEEGINSSDDYLSNAVAVSFVENLQGEPALPLLRPNLGSGLSEQLRKFGV
jgi:hypothetical protein